MERTGWPEIFMTTRLRVRCRLITYSHAQQVSQIRAYAHKAIAFCSHSLQPAFGFLLANNQVGIECGQKRDYAMNKPPKNHFLLNVAVTLFEEFMVTLQA